MIAAILVAGGPMGANNGPRLYPDDPLWQDNDRVMDASRVESTRVVGFEDAAMHTVKDRGDRRDLVAMNINSLGEVPDSSWFTGRIGRQAMTTDAIVRGPDRFMTLSIDGWPIVQGKGQGLQPGFRVQDPEGHLYQIKFDPEHRPEMSTAAEIIGTAFFHAFGYNVADGYLVEFDPEQTVIAPDAEIVHGGGRRRRLVKKDIEDALIDAARLPNGRYRAFASRFIDGTPLGEFRFWSSRSDDPNDIVPHEHRRELRGMRVFAAWLNHDEADSTNTLDVLLQNEGRGWVKHYLLDFGSVLGSDTTREQRGRSGNEYLLEWAPSLKTAATLGFWLRPWLRVDYPEAPPAIGQLESDFFDPLAWRPVYPNPAFENMRPDDAFWAARIVSRIDEAAIRGMVEKARYSDPQAAAFMVETLLARRQKVLRAWLTGVIPVVDVALSPEGTLTFANAAVDAGVATPPSSYRLAWFEFDNGSGSRTSVGEAMTTTEPRATMPGVRTPEGGYAGVTIGAEHANHPAWLQRPATVFFRRTAAGWQTVAIER